MNNSIFSLLFIAVSAIIVYFSSDFEFIKNFLKISPHVVSLFAVLTVAVCLRFNKGKVSFILVLLLLWFFKDNTPFVSIIPQNEFVLFITLNVLYLSLSTERGVFSVYGLQKGVFIIFQLGLFYYFTALRVSIYYRSDITVIQTINHIINWPYCMIPFILLFIAAIQNIFRYKNHDVSFAIGAIIGLVILFSLEIEIRELNMLAAFALMFVGTLSSVYTISYIDELTGLPGRRAYNEYMASLGSKYTIAMADIDHFKKFNDTHGHDTGDEVLKLVAKMLSTVGGGGKAYRFGGEEFVIVFNGKHKENTAEHMGHIRKERSENPFYRPNP